MLVGRATSPLFFLAACGGAPPAPAPPAALPPPVKVAAATVPKPDGLATWVHVEHASESADAYRLLVGAKPEPADAAGALFDLVGQAGKDDLDLDAVAASLADGASFDAAVRKVGDRYESAFAVSLRDEAAFRVALQKSFEVRVASGGFEIAKKQSEYEVPDADAGAAPSKPLYRCAWAAPVLSCSDADEPNPALRAWLASHPRTEAPGAVSVSFDAAPFSAEIHELGEKVHAADFRVLLEHFAGVRVSLDTAATPPSLATTIAATFHGAANDTFLFRGTTDTQGMQRVLAHWPADATVSYALPPARNLVAAAREETDKAEKPLYKLLAEHALVVGLVVEAAALRQVSADVRAAPLDLKKLEALRLRQRDAVSGYYLLGLASDAPTDAQQLATLTAQDSKTKSHAARGLPKGSVYVPATPKKDEKGKPTDVANDGTLIVPGPGVVWMLSGGPETYLTEAAQRLLAESTHSVAPFPAGSIGRGYWSPAFGSYWQATVDRSSFLPAKATPKPKPGVPAPYTLPAKTKEEARAALVTTADLTDKIIAKPRLSPIAIDLVAVPGDRPQVRVGGSAPLDVLAVAYANARAPFALLAFSATIGLAALLGGDKTPATP